MFRRLDFYQPGWMGDAKFLMQKLKKKKKKKVALSDGGNGGTLKRIPHFWGVY